MMSLIGFVLIIVAETLNQLICPSHVQHVSEITGLLNKSQ